VADTGPGVPKADREAIFDKFRQADTAQESARGGTGLGLAFCRMALEAQGGHIWVDNAPGWGAVFSFTLPIDADDGRPTTDD
jgi:signal transduction histidine kinase